LSLGRGVSLAAEITDSALVNIKVVLEFKINVLQNSLLVSFIKS
jgi:hypothetical protein